MHLRDIVELAALVATHGPARMRCGQPFPEEGIQQYWTASRCRIDRWIRALSELQQPRQRPNGADRWTCLRPVLEEVLVGEILTRVWTAIGCGCDQTLGIEEAAPVLQNVWKAHLDARNRVLKLMISGSGLRVEEVVSLNRLRRMSERWTDVLLSRLATECSVGRFAFSLRRVREFVDDFRDSDSPDLMWRLMRASLRVSYQNGLSPVAANADLNEKVAAGILTCFETQPFDTTGLPKSLWLVRMEQLTGDTQGMVEDLLSLDESTVPLRREPLIDRGRF